METNYSFHNKIFRLSTGEVVLPDVIESLIEKTCHYVKYAMLRQNDKNESVVFIFPKKNQYEHPDYVLTANDGCFCPRSLHELGKCMTGCLKLVNKSLEGESNSINQAILINAKSDSESKSNLSYKEILNTYRSQLSKTKDSAFSDEDEVYYIKHF